jgi:hypothetical protein
MILNNGIRHYEYLQHGHKYDNCLPDEDVFNYNFTEHAAQEFQRIARSKRELIGVEEAYQNICKVSEGIIRPLFVTVIFKENNMFSLYYM